MISIPFVAYASIFSFWSNTDKKTNLQANNQNSQNINILHSNLSPISGPVGGGDIAIVDDSALLPENSGLAQDKEHTNDQISVYVVRKGDTISGIAKMFNVSVNTIKWANDIKDGKVSPGEQLVILPISGVRHTVKKGDTIQSIARFYKADLEEIYNFNEIASTTKLSIGDVVIIPDGEVSIVQNLVPSKAGTQNVTTKTKDYSKAPSYDGYYIRPLIGGIKTQGIHGYNGVDIASSFGTNILASADGEVIVARSTGWNGGYGQYIVIKHQNGTQTLYGHLSGVQVSVGDIVVQGQVIGNMGSTGKSTGTHLHFEIRGAKNPF